MGGTALALQLGHRSSVDLDLFGTIPFSADEIRDALSENHSLTIVKESKNINSYFEDAEPDPMPMMFDEVSWETVKQSVRDAIASL